MSFVGKLDQFRLPDLLQILATSGKSGKLAMTRRDAEAMIVLRRGKIIYAASDSARETIGSLLLHQGLIDEEQLTAALDSQRDSPEEVRLGNLLVESGAVGQETLERVIRQQTERTLTELFGWNTGYFRFDLEDVADLGEIEVDAKELTLPEGLSADKVLIRLADQLDDELERREAAEEAEAEAAAAAPTPEAATDPPATAAGTAADAETAPQAQRAGEKLTTLRSVMAEIRSPEFTGELTLQILEYARKVVRRGVLFYIRQGNYCGMGQFGVGEVGEGSVRRLKVPVDQPSILADAADRKAAVRSKLAPETWNHYLISQLGGASPAEAIAVPLIVNDRVLMILYGDNLPETEPVGSIADLEVLMLQIGLAMEKRLFEKRVEQFKRLRGESV